MDFLTETFSNSCKLLQNGFYNDPILRKNWGVLLSPLWPILKILPGGQGVVRRPGSRNNVWGKMDLIPAAARHYDERVRIRIED